MSMLWIRELQTTGGGTTGVPFAMKAIYLFLRHCIGFTAVDVAALWDMVEKTGSNGQLSATDKNFIDSTAASFVVGDVGKWILVQSTDALNAGWYKITAYVDANTVTIDFRSATLEYPHVETGLTWKLLAATYQLPAVSDYFTIASPSVKAWQLKLLYGTATNPRIDVYVSMGGNWHPTRYIGSATAATAWFYCAASSDGTSVSILMHNSTTTAIHNAVLVTEVTPYDIGHSTDEQLAVFGTTSTAYYYAGAGGNGSCWRNADVNYMGYGTMRDSKRAAFYPLYMVDATYSGCANSFPNWTSREKNARLSAGGPDRFDVFKGFVVITDYDNVDGRYELLGRLAEPDICLHTGTNVRTAFNSPGTDLLDYFHFRHGICWPWPGITPQH